MINQHIQSVPKMSHFQTEITSEMEGLEAQFNHFWKAETKSYLDRR